MHATLSFDGLLIGYPALFEGLQVPDSVKKEDVVNNLLLDTIELEVMISSGPVMARALSVYSAKMLPSWTRYAKALGLEYSVLDTDDYTRTLSHSGQDNRTTTRQSKTDTTTNAESTRRPNLTTTGQNNGSDSTTREVAGFDSGQMQEAERTTTQLGTGNTITSSGTDSTTDTGTTNVTNSGTDTNEGTDSYNDKETRQGRTGAPPQNLVAAEMAIAENNVVHKIVADIKQQFCLLVY